jgi:DNA polymerase-4
MDRRIACVTVPELEIAVARGGEPTLRGWPTAIAPKQSRKPVLWQVSAEAREHGVFPGMGVAYARRLCPKIRLIAPDSRRLGVVHKFLQEVFRQFSPIHEVAADDEFYVDLSGSGRLFSDAAAIAERMQRAIASRCGLAGVVGLSINKLVAHVAADASGGASVRAVAPGAEKSFLAPLPLTSLPGLPRLFAPKINELLTTFQELCLQSIGQLAEVPLDQLRLVVGGKAQVLKLWSLGIDPSPVWPQAAAPLIQRWMCLETATADDDLLLAVIDAMVARICSHLRRHDQSMTAAKLLIQYTDDREVVRAERFDPATCWESEIYPALRERFLSIERRVRVRSIGLIGVSAAAARQLDLFADPSVGRRKSLCAAIDRVKTRYGEQAIYRGINNVKDGEWRIDFRDS